MSGNIPFLLKPAAKDYLWGGRRLNDEFNKGIDVYPLAETWECSTHPDGMSLVASGTDAGKPLIEVLREHPDYLGTHPLQIMNGKPELPVLIKCELFHIVPLKTSFFPLKSVKTAEK